MLIRFFAGAILALVLAVALGGCVTAFAGKPSPGGEFVDIGGRHLRLVCAGPESARPVVWFESGAFGQAEDFAVVQSRLVQEGVRSCAYDRAGLGFSDPGPRPRDGAAILADRDALIARAGVTGPFVVVAHSFGGLHARLWTASRPGEVAGLVLIDAAQPEGIEAPGAEVWVRRFGQFARVASGAAALGLLKPVAVFAGDQIGLPPAEAALKKRTFGSARHNRWSAAEVITAFETGRQALDAGPIPPALPVAVITAGPEQAERSAWSDARTAPARNSRAGSVGNVAAASHASILGRQHAEVVVQAVLRVLADAR